MPGTEDDRRLIDILDMIGRVAALDFSKSLPTSDKNDMIDAIALGLNMLSEELNTNVVEKSKLDEVNSKLEKFACTTAHDLKSPLNSLTGLVNLLELSLPVDENSEVFQYIEKLKVTTQKMKDMVQGILDYSRVDSTGIQIEKFDLNAVCNEIIETDQFNKQAYIQITEPLPVIYFNKSAIHQVIRNLLTNAVKYSDKKICKITVQFRELNDHYQISVSDNGPGIAPEHHEKIFELFNKIDSIAKADSHGIGLATIKRILEASGERIWVESSLGSGATFSFTIKKSIQVEEKK